MTINELHHDLGKERSTFQNKIKYPEQPLHRQIEKIKGHISRLVSRVIFPKQEIFGLEKLRNAKKPIIFFVSHDSDFDPVVTYSWIRKLFPEALMGVTAEHATSRPFRTLLTKWNFGRDLVFTANRTFGLKKNSMNQFDKSSITDGKRKEINEAGTQRIQEIIKKNGVVIVQGQGIPLGPSHVAQKLIPGADRFIQTVLEQNHETNIIPIRVTGAKVHGGKLLGLWRKHKWWRQTKIEVGDNLNVLNEKEDPLSSRIPKIHNDLEEFLKVGDHL